MPPPPPNLSTTDALLQTIVRLLARDRRRQLAPWEEIGFFQSPNVIVTPLTGPIGWAQIAPNNPNRVGLVIGCSGSTRISPDRTIDTGAGIPLTNTINPFIVREKDDGNLCTVQWFAVNGSAGVVTAIEVVLREFPNEQQSY